ncbi:hypothetical protein [Curtobacterium flaccumfaciens]|uniref:hypothetical protein n=1 Tax=Curtobacterium flaccumfaciens TaxID=2035 RepID=UPI0039A1DCD7
MLAGILLTLVGLADVVRARTGTDAAPRRVLTTTVIVLLWAAATAVAVLGLGIAVWSVLVTVVLAALWVATTIPVRSGGAPGRGRPVPWLRRSGSWPAVLLAVAVAVLLLWTPAADASGFVVDWHRDADPAFVGAVPLAALVAGIGAALFLVDSANVVVAQALPPGLSPDARAGAVAAEPTRRKRFDWRRTTRAPADDGNADADGTVTLKGGRMIGPIERLLLAGFSLAGAFPVVAALIAAKGIVRFPEIRRETTGYQAEYFLIGSLVSWAMAFAAAGMCWLLALG